MNNVVADSDDVSLAAVQGAHSLAGGTGVLGTSPANGVVGKSTGEGFSGVFGESSSGPGVSGSSDTSVGVEAKTKTGPAAMRAIHAGDGPGVIGACKGKGFSGVVGDSTSGPGVSGTSGSSVGVDAKTQTGPAALRAIHAGDGPGVIGACKGNGHAGVVGESSSGPGVSGSSNTSVGVDAISHGGPAALRAVQTEGAGAGVLAASKNGVGIHAKGGRLAGFFEGDVEVTGDIRLPNADCAENFDVCDVEMAQPGTVMVLDERGELRECSQSYDKRVAGVISGAGDYKPGIVMDSGTNEERRRPVALIGKVFCKVDAQFAAVEVGDLLTSSSTPGHAMKASDPSQAFGAVIGKALRRHARGQGLIPILVALQ